MTNSETLHQFRDLKKAQTGYDYQQRITTLYCCGEDDDLMTAAQTQTTTVGLEDWSSVVLFI